MHKPSHKSDTHTVIINKNILKTQQAGKMAQLVRALAALAEGLGLIPSTHMAAKSHP